MRLTQNHSCHPERSRGIFDLSNLHRSLQSLRSVGMTFLLLSFLCAPVMAQDETLPEDFDQRLELAAKMHEIWPVRPRVEEALDMAAQSFDWQNRPAFKAQMRRAINFDQLNEDSIKAMAEIYTAPELEAMIAFYGSPEGRAVSAKTGDYSAALQPVITRMLDQALMDVRTGTSAP